MNAIGFDGQGYDKQWIVCDDTSTSPFYGNCYIEADNTSQGNAELMATSSDGGQTWGAAKNPADSDHRTGLRYAPASEDVGAQGSELRVLAMPARAG